MAGSPKKRARRDALAKSQAALKQAQEDAPKFTQPMTLGGIEFVYERPWMPRYQLDSMFSCAKYTFTEGVVQCGKSFAARTWILEQCLFSGQDGDLFAWVSNTDGLAEKNRLALESLMHKLLPPKSWKTKLTTSEIIIPGKGSIIFVSGHNPRSIMGYTFKAGVLDECNNNPEDTYSNFLTRSTATGGPARFIGNFETGSWFNRICQSIAASQSDKSFPEAEYNRLTLDQAIAGGIVAKATTDAIYRLMGQDGKYRELYHAESGEDKREVFKQDKLALCLVAGQSIRRAVAFGVDIAATGDYLAIVGIDEYGHVCYFNRWKPGDEDWERTCDEIVEIIGGTPTLIDGSGIGSVLGDMICKRCPEAEVVKFSAQSRDAMIGHLKMLVNARRVGLPESGKPYVIYEELTNLRWKRTEKGNWTIVTKRGKKDSAYALAMAFYRIKPEEGEISIVFGDDPEPKNMDEIVQEELERKAERQAALEEFEAQRRKQRDAWLNGDDLLERDSWRPRRFR